MKVPPGMAGTCFGRRHGVKTGGAQKNAPQKAGQNAMIYGIGVDTASAARLEKSMAREHFVQRVFGPEERALLQGHSSARRAETAAANFAAKEALAKALGTGLSGFVWVQAQALREQSGAPYFAFSGQLAKTMRQKGLVAHLSLTHEGGFATAFVVLEQTARPAAHAKEEAE